MPRRGCGVSRLLVRTVRELLETLDRLKMGGSPPHEALAHLGVRSLMDRSETQEPSKAVHSRRS
jgi:hypothetical protein